MDLTVSTAQIRSKRIVQLMKHSKCGDFTANELQIVDISVPGTVDSKMLQDSSNLPSSKELLRHDTHLHGD